MTLRRINHKITPTERRCMTLGMRYSCCMERRSIAEYLPGYLRKGQQIAYAQRT